MGTNVLADTSVTGGNMAAVLAGLGQPAQNVLIERIVSCIAIVTNLVGILLAVRLVSIEQSNCAD